MDEKQFTSGKLSDNASGSTDSTKELKYSLENKQSTAKEEYEKTENKKYTYNTSKYKTLTEEDYRYINELNKGNDISARKLVDSHFKELGFSTEHLYHGTGTFGFTKIDMSLQGDEKSFFLLASEKLSKSYIMNGGYDKIRKIYDKDELTKYDKKTTAFILNRENDSFYEFNESDIVNFQLLPPKSQLQVRFLQGTPLKMKLPQKIGPNGTVNRGLFICITTKMKNYR